VKINEVPQEDAKAFEKEFNVLQYAVDDEGKFTTVKSVGWNPKTVVMQNAWDYENEKAEKARELVLAGKRSPLYFHTRKNMMNAWILSGYTGFSIFRVMLHFRPRFFNRLSEKKLKKYADAFNYETLDQLLEIPNHKAEK
jgi:hypothetical protein